MLWLLNLFHCFHCLLKVLFLCSCKPGLFFNLLVNSLLSSAALFKIVTLFTPLATSIRKLHVNLVLTTWLWNLCSTHGFCGIVQQSRLDFYQRVRSGICHDCADINFRLPVQFLHSYGIYLAQYQFARIAYCTLDSWFFTSILCGALALEAVTLSLASFKRKSLRQFKLLSFHLCSSFQQL